MILSTLLLLTPIAALPPQGKVRQLDRRPAQRQQAGCENCQAKAKQGNQQGGRDFRKPSRRLRNGEGRRNLRDRPQLDQTQRGQAERGNAGKGQRGQAQRRNGKAQRGQAERGNAGKAKQGQRGLKGQAQKDRFQKGPRAKSLKQAWQNHQKEAAVGKAAAGNKNRASKRKALAGFRQRLGAAIKSGKITRKEAGQKMAAMRKKVAAKKDSRLRPQD
jgi:hypothetical protein